jgi:hypothetical protein
MPVILRTAEEIDIYHRRRQRRWRYSARWPTVHYAS